MNFKSILLLGLFFCSLFASPGVDIMSGRGIPVYGCLQCDCRSAIDKATAYACRIADCSNITIDQSFLQACNSCENKDFMNKQKNVCSRIDCTKNLTWEDFSFTECESIHKFGKTDKSGCIDCNTQTVWTNDRCAVFDPTIPFQNNQGSKCIDHECIGNITWSDEDCIKSMIVKINLKIKMDLVVNSVKKLILYGMMINAKYVKDINLFQKKDGLSPAVLNPIGTTVNVLFAVCNDNDKFQNIDGYGCQSFSCSAKSNWSNTKCQLCSEKNMFSRQDYSSCLNFYFSTVSICTGTQMSEKSDILLFQKIYKLNGIINSYM